jgi:hypothetical protein
MPAMAKRNFRDELGAIGTGMAGFLAGREIKARVA